MSNRCQRVSYRPAGDERCELANGHVGPHHSEHRSWENRRQKRDDTAGTIAVTPETLTMWSPTGGMVAVLSKGGEEQVRRIIREEIERAHALEEEKK